MNQFDDNQVGFAGVNTGANDTTKDVTETTQDRRRRRVLAAATLVGDRVRNREGEDLGRIEEIMIDLPTGKVAYAVLSFGGFLGIGDKLFAVPWSALTVDQGEHQFILSVDRETLENAPGFDKSDWPDMADPSFESGIHSHYGKAPYWEHDITDAGDYVGDDRQSNRSIEYEPTAGYRAGGTIDTYQEKEMAQKVSTLEDLFVDEIRDLYDAEKQLVKALPKMAKAASSEDLKEAFTSHLQETEGHVTRLEHVFEELGQKARGKKCEAMEGLVEEGQELIESMEEGAVRDAGLIAAAQKVEHYEMAGYGSVRTHAELLGQDKAVQLLEETLEEEKAADTKLNELAKTTVNEEAAQQEPVGAGSKRARSAGRSMEE